MRFAGQVVVASGRDWIDVASGGGVARFRGYNPELIELEAGEVHPDVQAANEDLLQERARSALANNADFLALPSPTTAQAVAQVKALTRQVNALIRLEVRELGATD